jgi:tetratricopeptide (TPR) repeat protein
VQPTAAAHTELGDLLVRAGEWKPALEEFERAITLDSGDNRALSGAGQAAYELRDYAAAVRWLSRAQSLPAGLAEQREIALLVVAHDPLEPRLGQTVRRQRLIADVTYVNERLHACGAGVPAVPVPNPRAVLDQDAVEDALNLIGEAAQRIQSDCPPQTTRDRALAIIAQRHRSTER